MEIYVENKSERQLRMIVSGVTPAFMNTLRRTIISDIPKMAIETVEFHLGSSRDQEEKEYESLSPLFDEIIAHRLGMIPVPTEIDAFNSKEECECEGEGCPHCEIMYTLNKRGPCTVYSGDLEPLGDPSLRVKEDLIPIVNLDENQALLIYATAILGTGKKHAKWQSATSVGYRYYPEIVPNDLSERELKRIVKKSPKGFFKLSGDKIEIDNIYKCEPGKYGPWGPGASPDAPFIEVKGQEDKFIFTLESDGSLPAEDILLKALDIVEKKFTEFRKGISEL